MKNIEIKGKHHKDKIAKANNPNDPTIIAVRDCMQNMPSYAFDNAFQVLLINKIYLNYEFDSLNYEFDSLNYEFDSLNFEYKKECLREIDKKIASYKTQDVSKHKYDGLNITRVETIEKLVASKLRCHYCNCEMKIFYNKVRDLIQWTLDRIDNDLPHSCDNVVICCLKCNLQRRCQNKDKFLFSKQLKIVKNY